MYKTLKYLISHCIYYAYTQIKKKVSGKKRTPVKKKPRTRTGRPTKKTPVRIRDAIKYVKIGLSERTASDMIGVDFKTWLSWKKKDKTFSTSIKKAKSGAIVKATTKLVAAINKDNLTAIIFFLKTRSDEFKYEHRRPLSEKAPSASSLDTSGLIKAMDCITQLSREIHQKYYKYLQAM